MFFRARSVKAESLAANPRVPGDGDSSGPFYLFALIFTGVVGSLCWPTSFQRIYTASSVRAVKSGTIRTVLTQAPKRA